MWEGPKIGEEPKLGEASKTAVLEVLPNAAAEARWDTAEANCPTAAVEWAAAAEAASAGEGEHSTAWGR